MPTNPTHNLSKNWEVPNYTLQHWEQRTHLWCVVIPVINEGDRISTLLTRMVELNISSLADIIIIDGGSTDGSLGLASLKQKKVRGLLSIEKEKGLSAQLRSAYAFALEKGYRGIITIDGNNKDDPEAIPRFIEKLKDGNDFIQGSRFVPGGIAENTPISRDIAIRFFHAPILSLCSHHRWTDTTQGFRGYSRKLLLDTNVAPFRQLFITYELLAYLSYRAPKLGYRCIEIPTTRRYPSGGIPTKIKGLSGNLLIIKILFNTCLGKYNP